MLKSCPSFFPQFLGTFSFAIDPMHSQTLRAERRACEDQMGEHLDVQGWPAHASKA